MSGRVYLFDTTLRDGAQTMGVDFTVADKQAIAAMLDDFGIDYLEAGWPGANPTDTEFFAAPPKLKNATLTAFGMTCRAHGEAAQDAGLQALLDSNAPVICMVGKAWDFQVDVALNIPREENRRMIRDSVAHLRAQGRDVIFDAEHFFDGYKANPDYALQCCVEAYESGARWITLCDTNGGTLPDDIARIVTEIIKVIPGDHLGIHTHNDAELAVANTLAAVKAGARLVQGTLNGLGERCGNANLISIIPALMMKMGYQTGIDTSHLKKLTRLSHYLDHRLNRPGNENAPYVGKRAFAHKGGLHVSAIEKDPGTYEHLDPARVGNQRLIIVSDQSGRSNILAQMETCGLSVPADDPRLKGLLDIVKQRDTEGYAYDLAEASFSLLARRQLGILPDYFRLLGYDARERRTLIKDDMVSESEVTIKMQIGDAIVHTVAEGNGPVNAMDLAMRKALVPFYPALADLVLTNYTVRILQAASASAAIPRVLIETTAPSGESWTTIGVSTNIIDASCDALQDGFLYYLISTEAVLPQQTM